MRAMRAVFEFFKIREPEWSRRIARHWDLDPDVCCEVRTPDGSRADIVDATHAYEVEWAANGKWKQALGQAVFYAMALGKLPGIVLLIQSEKDQDDYLRCLAACAAVTFHGQRIRLKTFDIRKHP